MIELEHVDFSFGKKKVYQDLCLKLHPGQTTLITGVNGAGKSTLLRLMAGVLVPDGGCVRYHEALGAQPKKNMGFISDALSLYSDLTVGETLLHHQRMFGIERMDESLLGPTRIERQQKVGQLSVGQRTVVHFSLIFSQNPKVLLIDEVIHGLDAYLRQCVLDRLLEYLENADTTVVFVNLNFHDIEFMVDRVILLKNGCILLDEALERLKSRVRRISGHEIPAKGQILWQRQVGELSEWYVYGGAEDLGEGINLTEIVAAYIAGEYSHGH